MLGIIHVLKVKNESKENWECKAEYGSHNSMKQAVSQKNCKQERLQQTEAQKISLSLRDIQESPTIIIIWNFFSEHESVSYGSLSLSLSLYLHGIGKERE